MEWKTEKKLRTKNIQKQLLNKADACAIINLKSRVNKLEIDENCIKKKNSKHLFLHTILKVKINPNTPNELK